MQNGPNFQDLKNLKNRFRNEPARADLSFFYYISDIAYEVKKCRAPQTMIICLQEQN